MLYVYHYLGNLRNNINKFSDYNMKMQTLTGAKREQWLEGKGWGSPEVQTGCKAGSQFYCTTQGV